MAAITQPLRDEHLELLPHIEALRTLADSVGEASMGALRKGIDEAHRFLTHQLIPHADAEDHAFYPVIGKLMGATQATLTMSRDHVEIDRLTEELAMLRSELGSTLNNTQAQALRRVLYGLYTLIKLHLAKEEEVYLPIVDANMSASDAHAMFKAMKTAVKKAKAEPIY